MPVQRGELKAMARDAYAAVMWDVEDLLGTARPSRYSDGIHYLCSCCLGRWG